MSDERLTETPSDADTPPLTIRETLAEVLESIVASWDAGQIDNYGATDLILAVIRKASPPLDATRAAEPGLREALWQCGVESGMDTDGDTGPGALIAGMGDAGFASAMVEEVRRLRLAYDECLAEPEAGIDVQQVLAETLHEMQCRRKHPHPWDHSYSMMAGQLARALGTAPGKSA